ncbi:procollagen galactosyltransferase 2 [Tachypleus tridentatus]|uniref:procollagen galactosyltransferase 2 n=1 Tax=Tachypleus tridentatus TaxID=6853 RepID=UPI003FD4A7CC
MINSLKYRCKMLSVILILGTFIHLCSKPALSEQNLVKKKLNSSEDERAEEFLPTILIAILARNKAHTLPYFFGQLENLNYPKSRIILWIRTDHNLDESSSVIKAWVTKVKKNYHKVDLVVDDTYDSYLDEKGIFDWSPIHFDHIMNLRENALEVARNLWADYIFMVDCDVFLTNENTLIRLLEQKKTVIAPMLESLGSYSNFWCGMTEKGYYVRTKDYLPILNYENTGCFEVPMVHSAVLVNLHHKKSASLTYNPDQLSGYLGPRDDIITFAHSAKAANTKMYVLNTEVFGFILPPMEATNTLTDDKEQLINLKLEVTVDGPPLDVSPYLQHLVSYPPKDTLGFDQAYMINLLRRFERRKRMLYCFDVLGIKAEIIDAVDGKQLNETYIQEQGIKMLPGYKDPYHKRPLTMGEIGCFMSHYTIWKDIIRNQHRTALVFEDDIRFEPYFRQKLNKLMNEMKQKQLEWDLIYLGRKRLSDSNEPVVEDISTLVHVDYSYWTLCYIITLEGAYKLVNAQPLSKMVPVDEYLPIMFNRHPEESWKQYFAKRNLKAFSTNPLLVYPTHYTGEDNYISDTEDSGTITYATRDEL